MITNETTTLLKTPLYANHVSLGAKMAPFGGWLMPIQYEGILIEHAHTRSAVTVFDICHMGEFFLEGDPVLCGFDRVITQNIVTMPIGSCRYGFMLNEKAGIIDDLIVYRLKEKSWMLVVNAATIAGDEVNIRKNLKGEYSFENASQRIGKLDIQGPKSQEILKNIFGPGIEKLRYYTFSDFTFDQERCIISRTGYTGELGYEVYISSKNVAKLWESLLKDRRIKPAGLGCRDTLRLEMSYPLYGQDIDINHTPLQAGLDKFVDYSKDFIGKDAILKEKTGGLNEYLICFQADSRRSPRHGFGIFFGDKRVGTVTSGSFSPSLAVGIGVGYVTGNFEIGSELAVKEGSIEIPVKVVKKPFVKKTSL